MKTSVHANFFFFVGVKTGRSWDEFAFYSGVGTSWV